MLKFLIPIAAVWSAAAFAQDAGQSAAPPLPPPPADEVRRVIDYFYNGKDRGPTLMELKACLKVDGNKDSPTKFECIEEVKGPVKVGTTINGWVMFLVPKGGNYDDVVLQFGHEGQQRSTIDLKLDTEMRARTWRQQTLTKKGKWTVSVSRAGTLLGSTTVTAE